jgi:hypothetical protein
MDGFFTVFNTAEKILLVSGAVLLLIGILAPKSFLTIEIDWTVAKSGAAILIGVALLVLSYFQSSPPLPTQPMVPDNTLTIIRRDVKSGRDNTFGASTNVSDVRGCVAAAKTATQFLDQALSLIDEATSKNNP